MTATITAAAPVAVAPARLLSPQLVRLLVAVCGSCLNFYLMVSVVPLYLAGAGWSNAAAGFSTGLMMLATVATELAVPALAARYGYRALLAAGLLLLGIPSLVLAVSTSLPVVLAVCLARGAGFAIMFTADTVLVAELVPAQRRGEGLALIGLAAGAPAVLGLPLGIRIADHAGPQLVLLLAGLSALVGLVAVPGLPGLPGASRADGASASGASAEEQERPVDVLRTLGVGGLRRPTVVFAAITVAAGVVMTFLPLAVSADKHGLVATALLVQAAAAPLARWFAGRYGDRHDVRRLLVPSVLLAAFGAAALLLADSSVALVAGMVLFGVGFGAAQNVTLAMMLERVPASQYGRVNALWSVAYDGGIGIGAVGFGLVVGVTGYAVAFAVTALVLFAAVVPAVRDSRR